MQREFSKELVEDRSFEIGGQVFEWEYPHWTVGADLFDQNMTTNGDGTFSFKDDTEYAIGAVQHFLRKEDHKRWNELVKRKEKAVPRHQIVQLFRWLVQESSGLPTNPPSDSEPGGGSDTDSSKDE